MHAKFAGAMHDWRSMLPTLRMESMQRRHSVTGYSRNELLFATEFRLSPSLASCTRLPAQLLPETMCFLISVTAMVQRSSRLTVIA